MNAWNVVSNFSNFYTIHNMHLVTYKTPYLFFCCFLLDRPPNESHARLKLISSVDVPSVTILTMDAYMQAFFLISCEILDSRSECSFFLA